MRRVSDPLGKSTPFSAVRLHRTTTLQWFRCISASGIMHPLRSHSLIFLALISPTTSPHCKVRVAEFKSQSECRLGAPPMCVYIGHLFCLYFCHAPQRPVEIRMRVYFYACSLRPRSLKILICGNRSRPAGEIIVASARQSTRYRNAERQSILR